MFSVAIPKVDMPLASDAYSGNIHFVTWSLVPKTAYDMTWEN